MTTLTFDTSLANNQTALLHSTVTTCCAVYDVPVSDVFVTTQTGAVTIKARLTTFVHQCAARVKAAIQMTTQQVKDKAGKFWHRCHTAISRTVQLANRKMKPLTHSIQTRSKRMSRIIQFHSRRIQKMASSRFQTIRKQMAQTWIQSRPVFRKAGRIILVACVLYLLAHATLTVACVVIATLGVTGYDKGKTLIAGFSAFSKVPLQGRFSPQLAGSH